MKLDKIQKDLIGVGLITLAIFAIMFVLFVKIIGW